MEFTSTRIVNKAGLATSSGTILKINPGSKFINDATLGKSFKVYKRVASAGVKSKVSFDLLVGDVTAFQGQVVRLNLKYRMDYRGHETQFARDNVKFGQDDFSISATMPATIATTDALADLLVKKLNKGLNAGGNPIFKVAKADSSTASAKLLGVEAIGKNTVIEIASIEIYDATAKVYNVKYEIDEFTADNTGGDVLYTKQVEEFGTAAFIDENLRIITDNSVRPYGLHVDERPIDGVLYDQYTVEYVAERNDLSTGFPVGGVGKSKTTHVFYVAQGTTLSTAWSTAINAVTGVTIVTV